MDRYLKHIDKQIGFNQGKNIFVDKRVELKFVDETIKALLDIKELDAEQENVLVDYTTDKALEEFCRINQYYTFSSEVRNELRTIYADLFTNLKSNKSSLKAVETEHYQKLKHWLEKSNPFAGKLYQKADAELSPVECSEYKANLQMNLLKVDAQLLMEPVLDIGCGKNGNLVGHMRKLGIDIQGLDRFTFSDKDLIKADWLEFNYGKEKWGTIISNLGFSNHFKHHHLRVDGNYIEYAKKYMEILKSLKIGGQFHYAPNLAFIESYLDKKQFKTEKYIIEGSDFAATIIKRVK